VTTLTNIFVVAKGVSDGTRILLPLILKRRSPRLRTASRFSDVTAALAHRPPAQLVKDPTSCAGRLLGKAHPEHLRMAVFVGREGIWTRKHEGLRLAERRRCGKQDECMQATGSERSGRRSRRRSPRCMTWRMPSASAPGGRGTSRAPAHGQ
jgi:hypothetical protein